MAKKLKKKKIFVSYPWHSSSQNIANAIYEDMQASPFVDYIEVWKDDKTLKYKDSLKSFMENIRRADYAIILVGDQYFQRINCMREIMHLRKDLNANEKIIPLLVDNAQFFKAKDRLKYVNFWAAEYSQTKSLTDSVPNSTSIISSITELKDIKEIAENVDEVLSWLGDMNLKTFDDLKDNRYEILLKICRISFSETFSCKPTSLIDTSKHILDQLYDALNIYYKSFTFLPIRRLKLLYPLNIKGFAYSGVYTISTDNKELIDLFEDVKLVKANPLYETKTKFELIDDYQNKIDFIVRKLLNNNIHEVVYSNRRIHLLELSPKSKPGRCNCISCTYHRFDIKSIVNRKLRYNNKTELKELMSIAYYHYRLGNFNSAIKIFSECSAIAGGKNETILKFICEYNLVALQKRHRILDANWFSALHKLKIKLLPSEKQCKDIGFDEEIFHWIINGKFFSEEFGDIDEALSEIIKHYELHVNGGYSFNSNITKLLYAAQNLLSFINDNFIVYEHYGDYRRFISKLVEGILIGLVLPPEQSGMTGINDELLGRIIIDSDPTELLSYLRKYKIKSLHVSNVKTFIKWFSHFTDSFVSVKHTFLENNNHLYYQKRDRILGNFLIIVRYLDIGPKDQDIYALSLIKILNSESHFRNLYEYVLYDYILNNIKYLSSETAKSLLIACYERGTSHSRAGFEYLYDIMNECDLRIEDILPFNLLYKTITHDCGACKQQHEVLDVIPLLALYKGKDRQKGRQYLKKCLDSEFDDKIFVRANEYGVLSCKSYWDVFVNRCIASTIAKPTYNRLRHYNDTSFDPNDEFRYLISVCARNNIDMSQEIFKGLKRLGGFFEWALEPKRFDYENFDVRWLRLFPREIYRTKHFDMKYIKPAIKEYLEGHRDNRLEYIYLNY